MGIAWSRYRLLENLVTVVVLLAAVLPASAAAAACSPLTCSPSQFAFARGSLLGVRWAVGERSRVSSLPVR
jgi:hypothetical protein